MNIVTTPFIPEFTPVLPITLNGKRSIFFDIETTGFSAQTSYVYLIGCAGLVDGHYILTQWLCTEPSEEKELLRLFFDRVKDYDAVLHYNGTGFDLPFLDKKAKRHHLENPLSSLESFDLYTAARGLRSLFSLSDLKQKTMERFFGFSRTDIFSGADLIEVYTRFLGLHQLNTLTNRSRIEEENALAQVLLLHNAEDVKNLPSLTVLFFLQQLADTLHADRLVSALQNEAALSPSCVSLRLTYRLTVSLPQSFCLSLPWEASGLTLDFSAPSGTVTLSLPVVSGELKYFYPNPADYYYLPFEDCAMHKSVASFVEKAYRKKATAATCYTRQVGNYLPLYRKDGVKASDSSPVFESTALKKEAPKEAAASLPCFLSDYKSSYVYTPCTKTLLHNSELLTGLARTLLHTLL